MSLWDRDYWEWLVLVLLETLIGACVFQVCVYSALRCINAREQLSLCRTSEVKTEVERADEQIRTQSVDCRTELTLLTSIGSLETDMAFVARQIDGLRKEDAFVQRALTELKEATEALRRDLDVSASKFNEKLEAVQRNVESLKNELNEANTEHEAKMEELSSSRKQLSNQIDHLGDSVRGA